MLAAMRPSLTYVPVRAAWHGRLEEENLDLAVAGDEAGPDPALAPLFWRLVDEFAACKHAVETFVAALPADTRLPLSHRPDWSFAARDCGFVPGGLSFVALDVSSSSPTLSFVTGYPDGYAIYELVLAGLEPVSISAGCW
jgi:hypothetical protein